MEKKDKISVIIPSYNRAKLITKSIESVLNQTYDNIEVIVVDDGSTDNTEEVIKQISDKRVKYIKLKKNSGACHARNVGIEEATGKYIAFQDSDDEFLPTKLEKQYDNMIKNKADMDFCKMNIYTGDNIITVPANNREKRILKEKYLEELSYGNYIGTPLILITKKLAQKTLFNENLPRLQDYDFVLRAVPGAKLSYTREPLFNSYRQNDSISNSNLKLEKALLTMLNYDYNLSDKEKSNLKKYLLNTLFEINGAVSGEEYSKIANRNIQLEKRNLELFHELESIKNSKRWKLLNKIFKIFGK